jgi:hypothetical protein
MEGGALWRGMRKDLTTVFLFKDGAKVFGASTPYKYDLHKVVVFRCYRLHNVEVKGGSKVDSTIE